MNDHDSDELTQKLIEAMDSADEQALCDLLMNDPNAGRLYHDLVSMDCALQDILQPGLKDKQVKAALLAVYEQPDGNMPVYRNSQAASPASTLLAGRGWSRLLASSIAFNVLLTLGLAWAWRDGFKQPIPDNIDIEQLEPVLSMAKTASAEGRKEDARLSYQKAIELYAKPASSAANRTDKMLSLASLHIEFGDMLRTLGDSNVACAEFEKAREILATPGLAHPIKSRLSSSAAIGLRDSLFAKGDLDLARDVYRTQ